MPYLANPPKKNIYMALPLGSFDVNNQIIKNTGVLQVRCTCTANVYPIQRQLIDEKITPINSDDVAQALHKRNLLRQTKVIQVSSNIK